MKKRERVKKLATNFRKKIQKIKKKCSKSMTISAVALDLAFGRRNVSSQIKQETPVAKPTIQKTIPSAFIGNALKEVVLDTKHKDIVTQRPDGTEKKLRSESENRFQRAGKDIKKTYKRSSDSLSDALLTGAGDGKRRMEETRDRAVDILSNIPDSKLKVLLERVANLEPEPPKPPPSKYKRSLTKWLSDGERVLDNYEKRVAKRFNRYSEKMSGRYRESERSLTNAWYGFAHSLSKETQLLVKNCWLLFRSGWAGVGKIVYGGYKLGKLTYRSTKTVALGSWIVLRSALDSAVSVMAYLIVDNAATGFDMIVWVTEGFISVLVTIFGG